MTSESPTGSQLETGLDRYRAVRHELEAAVLPLATSIDGRHFSFQAPLHHLELRVGGYVVIEHAGGASLGQIAGLRLERTPAAEIDMGGGGGAAANIRAGVAISHAAGDGAIVDGEARPFHDAAVRPATADEVRAWVERGRAALEIGTLALASGVPCRIDASGFDRHTFLCGQSGSGKTYSLGVLLERLLLETTLRIVILDPNSDFVRLAEVRTDADSATAARYAAAAQGVTVHSAGSRRDERLRVRLADLEPEAQAALLRLDPVADREEHAELIAMLESGQAPSVSALEETGRPDAHRLALRARNLRLEGLQVWAGAEPGSVLDAVADPAARCTVVDLGSLATRDEQSLVAEAVLGELWRRREQRNPVLIVIDEAHNVCPAAPEDRLTALAAEAVVRIAAEGRKFGLYLLVSTQRPQKVQENVISQCDNLLLMRLNSRADTAFAEEVFSFVPASLIAQASSFGLGEALVAGKISPNPALVRFRTRVAEEGGSDVPSDWAAPQAGTVT